MIKVFSLYNKKIVTDITSYCKAIVWSGDISQCARKLECTLAYPIWDTNQPHTQIEPGNLIWIVDESGNELFRGIVFDRDIESDAEEIKFIAYDFLIYILKSKVTYNFTNILAEKAVEKIATDLDIKYNNIPSTKISIKKLYKGKAAYDAIMAIYTYVSYCNGKQYIPIMQSDKLSIIEKGTLIDNFILKPDVNMGGTSYSDSIGNMINKIRIYDEKGNYIRDLINDDWIASFGILQDVYEESKKKNTGEITTFKLHGMDRAIKVPVLGDTRCITGYAVKSQIFYLSVLQNAILYIDADTHTWEVGTGKYTMELTLNLDNIMDRKED